MSGAVRKGTPLDISEGALSYRRVAFSVAWVTIRGGTSGPDRRRLSRPPRTGDPSPPAAGRRTGRPAAGNCRCCGAVGPPSYHRGFGRRSDLPQAASRPRSVPGLGTSAHRTTNTVIRRHAVAGAWPEPADVTSRASSGLWSSSAPASSRLGHRREDRRASSWRSHTRNRPIGVSLTGPTPDPIEQPVRKCETSQTLIRAWEVARGHHACG